MLESFLGALSPLLMMFICILAGFILNKLNLMPESTGTVLSKCVKYLFLPATGYAAMSKNCTMSSIVGDLNILLYSMLALAIAMAIAIPLSKAFEKEDVNKRNIYQYALVIANYGTMGNVIVPMVLGGQEHLYKYLVFTLPLSIVTYLWGMYILTPKEYRYGELWKNLINAPMVGLVLGMVVGLTGIQQYMPKFFVDTMDALQNCLGPVAMIVAGYVIGDYRFGSLLSDKKVYIATGLRLIVLPAILVLILYACGADTYTITLALFAFATPLGLNTIVFPAIYNGDTKTGASMTMISHVLCVITIPVMYGLLTLLR